MMPGEPWTVAKSEQLYGFEHWGAGYFRVNARGNVSVWPNGPDGSAIDLQELVEAVRQRDIQLPVLFRFNGILRHRLRMIHGAFTAAIAEYKYRGEYRPVYPIKVNQQRHVVNELSEAGRAFNLGLEVGSKPELIAVLAIQDNPDALLICNGYKDRQYLELALMARRVGRRSIVVIEKPSEIDLLLKLSEEMGVEPEIGFRLRLAGRGAGRWERSGGERAKFGLTVSEIAAALQVLREHGKLHWVKLLHFHIGSQLTNISSLKRAVREASQVYVQLSRHCPQIALFDVGGGLAVDYDGSKTAFESSMNYTVEEYARDVVWILMEACDAAQVTHPTIVTECGRAMVAFNSVLVMEVLGLANTFSAPCDPRAVLAASDSPTIVTMAQMLQELTPKNCQETLHDANELRQDMLQQFSLGLIPIEDRALGDQCYWALLNAINGMTGDLHYVPEDLQKLPALLTDTYFCNLSIFQSMPDSWAVDQIFPITPITRLGEEPRRRVVLADITCDSDGKIDRFADLREVKHYLPAHDLRDGEQYCFAVFLVGAYQEILGDLHNLFGDTNAVHVDVNGSGQVTFAHVVRGDSVGQVLRYVQYEKADLVERWRHALERAVSEDQLTARESAVLQRKYEAVFNTYTYLR
ncbi:MAG TPA: biosynthetic arginine decarboxylase [Candidatus Krumholzibacteria bacterium]|nr:biosynthetic arginine decarboxylase [Candidatus Krumholzibacteria bacterium]HPD72202.1 biosynthetic arginine decarboxylase [Candidatus Krumholzibacteria bacterium]HRY40866.1 biosynthetic arginine decarboxylase [Candidatus Krumholzibacteria bacterium]